MCALLTFIAIVSGPFFLLPPSLDSINNTQIEDFFCIEQESGNILLPSKHIATGHNFPQATENDIVHARITCTSAIINDDKL